LWRRGILEPYAVTLPGTYADTNADPYADGALSEL